MITNVIKKPGATSALHKSPEYSEVYGNEIWGLQGSFFPPSVFIGLFLALLQLMAGVNPPASIQHNYCSGWS